MHKNIIILLSLLFVLSYNLVANAMTKDKINTYLNKEGIPKVYSFSVVDGTFGPLISIQIRIFSEDANYSQEIVKQMCRDLQFLCWQEIIEQNRNILNVEVTINLINKNNSHIITFLSKNGLLDLKKEYDENILQNLNFTGQSFYDWLKKTAILVKTTNIQYDEKDKERATRYKNGDFLANNTYLYDSLNENDIFNVASLYNKYGLAPATPQNFINGKNNYVGRWQNIMYKKNTEIIDISIKDGKYYVIYTENGKKITESFALFDIMNKEYTKTLIVRNNGTSILISDITGSGKELEIDSTIYQRI